MVQIILNLKKTKQLIETITTDHLEEMIIIHHNQQYVILEDIRETFIINFNLKIFYYLHLMWEIFIYITNNL